MSVSVNVYRLPDLATALWTYVSAKICEAWIGKVMHIKNGNFCPEN